MKKSFKTLFYTLLFCSLGISFIYSANRSWQGVQTLEQQRIPHVGKPFIISQEEFISFPGEGHILGTKEKESIPKTNDYKSILFSIFTMIFKTIQICFETFWTFFRALFRIETYVAIGLSLIALLSFIFRGSSTFASLKSSLIQLLFTPFYFLWYTLDKLEKIFDSYMIQAIFGKAITTIAVLSYMKGIVLFICQTLDAISGENLLQGEILPFGMKDLGAKSTLQEWHEFLDPSMRTKRLLAQNDPIVQRILSAYPLAQGSRLQLSLEKIFPKLHSDRLMSHLDDIFNKIQAGELPDPDLALASKQK